jgi:hypothetical protein
LLLKAIIWKFSVLSFGDHFTSSASWISLSNSIISGASLHFSRSTKNIKWSSNMKLRVWGQMQLKFILRCHSHGTTIREKQPVPVTDHVTFQKHKFHTHTAPVSIMDTVKSDSTSKSTYSVPRCFFKWIVLKETKLFTMTIDQFSIIYHNGASY